jgi:hypothetical protein
MSEQPSLPELPTPPEPPEFIKWARWLDHYVRYEGEVIRKAPGAFAIGVLAAGAFIFFGLEWHHGSVDATKDATIENQKSNIAVLEEEVKGLPPQQAAINVKRKKIVEQLQSFYVEAGPLINQEIPKSAPIEQFNSWKINAQAWADKTGHWISDNMGDAAREKFYDDGNGTFLFYSSSYNEEHNRYKNFLARLRRNLSTLIETNAWDRIADSP